MNNKIITNSKFHFVFIMLLLSIIITISSCNKDQYTDYNVVFYSEPPNYQIKSAIFDTITIQFLAQEAYNEGATFETKTEQYLVRDSYFSYEAFNQVNKLITTNFETDQTMELTCIEFLDSSNLVKIEHPATYKTRTYKTVKQNGNGVEKPAKYISLGYQKLISNSAIEANSSSNRLSKEVMFRLPKEKSIDSYIQNELNEGNNIDCINGISYSIM